MNNKNTRFNLLSAGAAFFLWGSWAYYANSATVENTAIASGLAQGSASFMITLFMVYSVAFFYARLANTIAKLVLPAVLTICCTATCLVIMHLCIGTKRIFLTIAPPLSIAFIFCLYTSYRLYRADKTKELTL